MNNLPPLFTGILHSYLRISEQQNPEKTVSDIKKEILEGNGDEEIRKCELCGSDSWRILHEGDESNCDCEGECLCVDLGEDGEGPYCDGVAELVKKSK
jgi:hypothetical protein